MCTLAKRETVLDEIIDVPVGVGVPDVEADAQRRPFQQGEELARSVHVVIGIRGMFSRAATTPFSAAALSISRIDVSVSLITAVWSSWPNGDMNPGAR